MSSFGENPPRFGLDKDPPLQLEFIDHGDNNARKRVRSHAMKDVQRRKRWDYARSTDNKRRTEERERQASTTDPSYPEKRQEPSCSEGPLKVKREINQQQTALFNIMQPTGPSQRPKHATPSPFPQPQSKRLTTCSASQLYSRNPSETANLPLRSLPPPRSRTSRMTRRGTPDENSEPSLVDDESTTPESRHGAHSSGSPDSDKWDDSQMKRTSSARYTVIADPDVDSNTGNGTDSEFEDLNTKSRHHSYNPLISHDPHTSLMPHPRSSISAGRYDPFDSLAKTVAPEDRVLVDHRIFVLPNLMFRVPSCCALSLVMAGPLSFQASALAYSAAHLTRLRGQEDRKSIMHKSTALVSLNEGIQTISLRTCLDVLYAILGLAMLEARFGDKGNAWLHMRGALQVVEKFQENPLINKNRDINFWLPWILITIEGYDLCALQRSFHEYPYFYGKSQDLSNPTECSNMDQIAPPSPQATSCLYPVEPIIITHAAIEEFLHFLLRIDHLALMHAMVETKLAAPDWLFAILSLPPGAREGVRGASIQTTSRLASLIYLNAALWEFHSSPLKLAQFLQALKDQIVDYKLGWTFSIEKLLHVMIEAENEMFAPSRSFFTARMVNVAKRLSEETWDRVNDFLMGCLRIRFEENNARHSAPGHRVVPRDKSFLAWEGDLRRELWSKPITAHEYYPSSK